MVSLTGEFAEMVLISSRSWRCVERGIAFLVLSDAEVCKVSLQYKSPSDPKTSVYRDCANTARCARQRSGRSFFASNSSSLVCAVRRRWNLAGMVLIVLVALCFFIPGVSAGALPNSTGKVELLKVFPLGKGSAVLCYKDRPSFVFASERPDGKNVVSIVPFDGSPKEILGFYGRTVSSTLSCSADGQTIALVSKSMSGTDYDLFVIRDGSSSRYRLRQWTTFFPIVGTTSLLSEDGDAIALPASPEHISGPDIMRDMRLFVYEGKAFFANRSIVNDRGATLEQLSPKGNRWERRSKLEKKAALFVEQAGYCFGHTIAVLRVDESSGPARLYDITRGKLSSLPAAFSSAVRLTGDESSARSLVASAAQYGRCVYLFGDYEGEFPRFSLSEIVTVDRDGATIYGMPDDVMGNGQRVTLESFRVGITKDGCRLLISAYPVQPRTPMDHGGEGQVVVLKLKDSSAACN